MVLVVVVDRYRWPRRLLVTQWFKLSFLNTEVEGSFEYFQSIVVTVTIGCSLVKVFPSEIGNNRQPHNISPLK